ncbi:MAG TPA: histidine kinase [Steroidobacteraceae bacterium]|nr:histidine kinase [Steroidobacteraceae bacterium]
MNTAVLDTPAIRVAPRLFWPLQIGGWTGAFLMSYLAALAHGKPAEYWTVTLSAYGTGFVVTLGLRWILQRVWNLPPGRMVAIMVVPVLIASGIMSAMFLVALVDWCGEECVPSSPLGYAAYMTTYVYVMISWVGLYVGIKYYGQLQEQTRQALAANAMAHQAQLKMLRYQLNPHFLFNTLNAISTLILDKDTATANRVVQGLSAFLRHSLDNDPMQRVTLKQELDALNLYLDIEKTRFAERLQIETAIERDCYSALLPGLLLQPLVENAIKYAVARKVEGGKLRIGARRVGNTLVLTIADNGPGCAALEGGKLPPGHGVGLRNTRERLRVLYGQQSGFDVRNLAEGGLEVTLRLPFEAGGAPRE